jgi:transposase-like protein
MRKRVRRSDPHKEQQWRSAVQEWQKSGQSIRDYCRAHGLRESTFYFWRRELVRRGSASIQQPGEVQPPAGTVPRDRRGSAPRRPVLRAVRDQARFLPVRVLLDWEQPGNRAPAEFCAAGD